MQAKTKILPNFLTIERNKKETDNFAFLPFKAVQSCSCMANPDNSTGQMTSLPEDDHTH